jgi:hypothetical protein
MDPVEGQLVAYNARDVDSFAPFFTEDVIVEDAAGTRLMTGRAELYASYAKMFAANPALHCNVVSRMRAGRFVVDEERITGRGPDEIHVIVCYTLRGELIERVHILR